MTNHQMMIELEDEYMAQFGDPRRCPFHPGVRTSSPDGMHDAPCRECEVDDEEDYVNRTGGDHPRDLGEQERRNRECAAEDLERSYDEDDIPF